MGLDMYVHARRPDNTKGDDEEFWYWRKHNALHGWMEAKFRERNPNFDGDFNCVHFELDETLLDELETAINSNSLKPTSGFFFGSDDYDPAEYADKDLEMIKEARRRLKNGQRIAYFSWW